MWPDNLSNAAVLLWPKLDDIMKSTFNIIIEMSVYIYWTQGS